MSAKKETPELSTVKAINNQLANIALAVVKLEETFNGALLSTKNELKSELKNEIGSLRQATKSDLNQLESRLDAKIFRLEEKITNLERPVTHVIFKEHAPRLENHEKRIKKIEDKVFAAN